MFFAKIIVNNFGSSTNREYTYIVPKSLTSLVFPGVRVIVPFGKDNKDIEGIVCDMSDNCELSLSRLKEIKEVIDKSPIITEDLIELIHYIKDEYLCDYMDAVKLIIPPELRLKTTRKVSLNEEVLNTLDYSKLGVKELSIIEVIEEAGGDIGYEELLEMIEEKKIAAILSKLRKDNIISIDSYTNRGIGYRTKRVVKIRETLLSDDLSNIPLKSNLQRDMLQHLKLSIKEDFKDLLLRFKCGASVIKGLEKKGFVEIIYENVIRNPAGGYDYQPNIDKKVLTFEQSKIVEDIKKSINSNKPDFFLLKGVTGSGKTEVYLKTIDEALSRGKDAIVLVPEIALTPQTVERFVKRFGDRVAVLHSRLSQGERHDQWQSIAHGKVKIVVGARSAIFAPFKNLGVIVIDEEHENTYKSESTPKYNAIDVAMKRCNLVRGVLILGSATPSLESYYRALQGQFRLVKMDKRVNNMELPAIDIIDMRNELTSGNKGIFSLRMIEEIRKCLDNNNQAILFLNRRGYANFVSCKECGIVLKCKNCDITLTYHSHGNHLSCHYCGYRTKNPTICPKCSSNKVQHFGLGTQKVEKEIMDLLPGVKVVRMDLDTTASKGAHQKILGDFAAKKYNVLIGTQMISKGLDFPDVTLVGVISGDMSLNLPDFRASERTFQLLTQVAGRSGRAESKGSVIIQTYQPDHYAIEYSKNHDYEGFVAHEIQLRREFEYPPFYNIGSITLSGTVENEVIEQANSIVAHMRSHGAGENIQVYGPSPAPLSLIKRKFRWQVMLKEKDIDKLRNYLIFVQKYFKQSYKGNTINISLDINPLNLL